MKRSNNYGELAAIAFITLLFWTACIVSLGGI